MAELRCNHDPAVVKPRRNDQNHDEERDARIEDILVRAKQLAERAKRLKKRVAKLRRGMKQRKGR